MDTESVKIEFTDVFSAQPCTVTCGRILRQLQGKRIVYEGYCNDREAVIKLFLSRLHARRHWMREKKGLNELAKRDICSAGVIAGGKTAQGHYVLALEKIHDAVNLFDIRQDISAERSLFVYFAGMHQAGVVQWDLHRGNFLWDGNKIYALDPAMMTFSSRPLCKHKSAKQLAVMLLSFVNDKNRRGLVQIYYQTRNWKLTDNEYEEIERLSHKYRLKGIEAGLAKTLRTGKRVIREKTGEFTGVFDRQIFDGRDIKRFMLGLDEAMELGTILKRGDTCFVSKITFDGSDVVVKRYNHKGLFHSLRHTIKGSRARKSWLFGQRLACLDISCAKPLAFIEQRKCGLIWKSYIINEFISGPDLYALPNSNTFSDAQKQHLTAQTKDLMDYLSANKMTHGDLKPSNILINDQRPVLIDLDSMKRHHCTTALTFRKNKMMNDFNRRLLNLGQNPKE